MCSLPALSCEVLITISGVARMLGFGGGQKIGGLGDGSPPVGSSGEAPVGGLGDEVPQKLKSFCKSMH